MKLTRIDAVVLRQDLSKYEAYAILKKAMGLNSLQEAKELVDKMKSKWEHYVWEDDVPKLQSAFTFHNQTAELVQLEIERKKYEAEIEIKIESARKWFNTLTEEQKEFVRLLSPSPAMG